MQFSKFVQFTVELIKAIQTKNLTKKVYKIPYFVDLGGASYDHESGG